MIELATAIIVTGVVATLPYAAYRTHRVRSEVSDGVALAAAITPLIVDSVRRRNGIPPELSSAISVAFQKTPTALVIESVAVVDGRIDVLFGNAADPSIAGLRISLTPYETADSDVVWICGNALPGPGLNPLGFAQGGPQAVQVPSSIEPRYLPADCR